jgi:RNA polymerase sigma factor (sigma-70 family)
VAIGYSDRVGMESTSATLLERVKDAGDADAWHRFFRLYYPLLAKYARMRGLRAPDAEEVAQECMNTLAGRMRNFRYRRGHGRFKEYLRTMVDHRIINLRRRKRPRQARTGELEGLAWGQASGPGWHRLWLREHLACCLETLESRASDDTVEAFRLYALQSWPVEKVCETLGMTANQVYLAKSRMIRRLRNEITRRIGDVL